MLKSTILNTIPEGLRNELFSSYSTIEKNFREGRWEPAELNGGKLCEVTYSILRGFVDGNYPSKASKPRNIVDSCKALEGAGNSFSRSIRIQIPRVIIALYEIRNNRGVGHIGGDVNPNMMDALCVLHMSKWIIAEIIRIFHSITTEQAQAAVELISQRELSLVWEIDGKRRVLDTSLSMPDKTLVLLYRETTGMTESDLLSFTEHSNASIYRREVLNRLHKKKMIEYDKTRHQVNISPLGIKRVEEEILV